MNHAFVWATALLSFAASSCLAQQSSQASSSPSTGPFEKAEPSLRNAPGIAVISEDDVSDFAILDLDRDSDLDLLALAVEGTFSRTYDITAVYQGETPFGVKLFDADLDSDTEPEEILPGDFDNDGRLDLLLYPRLGFGQIQIIPDILNATSFTQPILLSELMLVQGLVANDFNNDGLIDLAFGTNGSNGLVIQVVNNLGSLTFSEPETVVIPSGQSGSPRQLLSTDLDGDLLPELVYQFDLKLRVFWNENTDRFTTVSEYSPTSGLAISDLDFSDPDESNQRDIVVLSSSFNSGFEAELLTATRNSISMQRSIAERPVERGLGTRVLPSPGGQMIRAVIGFIDDTTGAQYLTVVSINEALPGNSTEVTFPVQDRRANTFEIEIVDNYFDGMYEIGIQVGTSWGIILLNETDSGYDPDLAASIKFDPGCNNCFINGISGDFNGDGLADIAARDTSFGVHVYLNSGDGSFGNAIFTDATPPPSENWAYQSTTSADMNNDGVDDLVFTRYDYSNFGRALGIALGNGDGTFSTPTFPATFSTTSYDTVLDYVRTADLNNDGWMDAVAITAEQPAITRKCVAMINNQAGGFTVTDEVFEQERVGGQTINERWNDFELADVNGDSILDLIAVDEDRGFGSSSTRDPAGIIVHLGAGDGTFTRDIKITAGDDVIENILVTDVDNDGDSDFVCIPPGGDYWLFENVNGTITGRSFESPYESEGTVQSTMYDWDHDGFDDVVTWMNDNTVVWYKNTAGTGFEAQSIIPNTSFGTPRGFQGYNAFVVDDFTPSPGNELGINAQFIDRSTNQFTEGMRFIGKEDNFAPLRSTSLCQADLNQDGELTSADLSVFINAYRVSDLAADIAEPFGEINFFDVSAYLSMYRRGCP